MHRSQVMRLQLVTKNPYTKRALVGAGGLLGASIVALLATRPDADKPRPAQRPIAPAIAPSIAPAIAPPSSELQLVIRAGDATYLQLAGVDEVAAVPHGAPVLFDRGEQDAWQTTAVAEVAYADVPRAHRDWVGRTVIVDGACEAKVTGFAIVSRLIGSPDYADGGHAKWTATNVRELGASVLAAKLDGCTGTLARDARLAPIVYPQVIDAPALAERARAKLLASGAAYDAQHAWTEHGRTGAWHADDTAAFDTIVARHPTTGVTWVSAHARIDEGCGGPEINIWGLYRVAGDELVVVEQRELGELWKIARLVDLEGDGALELVGNPWLATDDIVTRADGEELARLTLPFFGCPC